jgi:hypothetical protein
MATESVTIIGLEDTSPQPGRRRDGVELAIGYSLILLVIWTPRPWQRLLYIAAAIFLVIVTWRSFESVRAMGLRTANLLRSLWVVIAAVLLAGAVLLLAAHLDTLHRADLSHGVVAFCKRYWGYALWAFAQQILLQDFFLRRMLRLVSREGAAVLVAAGIFSLAHLPNPILTVVTFLWGLIACTLFLRYRNLYPVGIAHALLGITIALSVPGPVIHNMRVGLGYLTYAREHHGRHQEAQRSQADHTVSTRAWVKAEAPTRRS